MSMLPSLPQSQANTSKNTNIFLTEARVYIAGILMPTLDVSINSIFNQPPTANITLPAHPELFQIGDRDRVPVHIFVRETMVECPNFILLFEGFITGKVYTNSALQRVITLSATSVFDILNDIEVKFMSQIEDFYEMHVPGNSDFVKYVNGGGIAFPASLVMYGLIQDKDNAKVITSPSDYLDNIYAYMQLAASEESVPQEEGSSAGEQEEGAPPPLLAPHRVADRQLRPLSMLHASAMSTYYGNQARLYNFLDRFERLPYYDKPGKTPEGEEKTAWELCGFSSDGSYATAFPMLYGLQTQAAMMQVYKHMQQASPHRKLSELLAFLVEEMEYEYLFVSNPAYHAAEEEQDEAAKAAQAENKKENEKTPEEKEAEGVQNAEKYGNAVATYTSLKYTEQGKNVPNREALMSRSREQAHQYGTKVGLSSADVEQHLNEPVASAEGRVERQKALGAKIVTATGSEKSKEAYYRGTNGVFEQIDKHKAAESQQRLSDILGSRLKNNEPVKASSSSSGRVLRRASASAPAGAVPASGGTYRESTTTYNAARELVGLQDNTGNPEATLSGTAKKWQRNKNPGNVTGTAAQAAKVNGRDEKKHLIFATYSEGIVGWRNYFVHKYFDAQSVAKGENTLEKIVYKYAPPHENATAKYLNDLERLSGIPRNQKITPDTETLAKIGSGIFQLETSHQFSREEIKAVWRASDANPNAVRSVYGQHIPAGPSISGGGGGASSGGSSGGSAGGSSAGGTGGSGGSGGASAPELATPPASAPEMPASGEESPKRAKLVSSCLKPLLNDALPPKCNVMFRTMVTGVQTSFQYKGVPTRVQVRDVASALAQLLNDSNSALAQLGTIDYYPSQKYKKFEAPAGGDEKSQVTRWLSTEMLEDEKYTGPWVSVVGLPPWFNYVLNLVVKEKGDGVENPVKVFKERFFRRQLLGAKYLSRQITASGMFDPYVTPGFPGVVFDSADTGLAFAGHVLSVTHNISPQDVSTRVDMNFVRTLDEAIAEPIPHPLTPIDKINHDPAYLSNVYQTLLGTPGESVPGAEAVTFDSLDGTSVGGNNPAEAYQYKRRNICTFEDYCSFMEFTVTTGNGPEGPNTPLKLSGTLLDDRRPIVVMTTVQVPQEQEAQQPGQQQAQQEQQSSPPVVENVIPKQEENFPPIDDTQGKEADEAKEEAEEGERKPEGEQTVEDKKAIAVQNAEKYGEAMAVYGVLSSDVGKDVPNREALQARAREQAYHYGEQLGVSRQETEARVQYSRTGGNVDAATKATAERGANKIKEDAEIRAAVKRGETGVRDSVRPTVVSALEKQKALSTEAMALNSGPRTDSSVARLGELSAKAKAVKKQKNDALHRAYSGYLKKNEPQSPSAVEKKAATAAATQKTTPAGQTMQQPSATLQPGTQQASPKPAQQPQGQQQGTQQQQDQRQGQQNQQGTQQQEQQQQQPMVEKREARKMDVREVLYAIAQKEFARVIFN